MRDETRKALEVLPTTPMAWDQRMKARVRTSMPTQRRVRRGPTKRQAAILALRAKGYSASAAVRRYNELKVQCKGRVLAANINRHEPRVA